jgi:hypothetical protein
MSNQTEPILGRVKTEPFIDGARANLFTIEGKTRHFDRIDAEALLKSKVLNFKYFLPFTQFSVESVNSAREAKN